MTESDKCSSLTKQRAKKIERLMIEFNKWSSTKTYYGRAYFYTPHVEGTPRCFVGHLEWFCEAVSIFFACFRISAPALLRVKKKCSRAGVLNRGTAYPSGVRGASVRGTAWVAKKVVYFQVGRKKMEKTAGKFEKKKVGDSLAAPTAHAHQLSIVVHCRRSCNAFPVADNLCLVMCPPPEFSTIFFLSLSLWEEEKQRFEGLRMAIRRKRREAEYFLLWSHQRWMGRREREAGAGVDEGATAACVE